MFSTMKSPLPRADSLPNISSPHTSSPLKSSFTTISSDSSDILSAVVLHKRRSRKRVRFALKLESVEEDSLPSTRASSESLISTKSSSRVIDPWRESNGLHDAYVEYSDKQDGLSTNEFQTCRMSPPRAPPPPEPGAKPPTYTHTFVIQSKSPEMIINSITVSTPSFHLPRILQQTKKTNKQQLPILDSYVKQQLALSTSPRIIHSKKLANASNRNNHYEHVQAALKRAELVLPLTQGLHTNNRIARTEPTFGGKVLNEQNQPRKIMEIITRPFPGVNNQINHFSDRTILPNYSNKPQMYNRAPRTNDESNSNVPYFSQNSDVDHPFLPKIHSSR